MSSLYRKQPQHYFLVTIFSIFLTFLAPAANAVTKHLSMIGKDGKPLTTQLITITAPDGSSTQRVTDDKGILQHDFKQGGVYKLSDSSGYQLKTVSVAGTGMNTTVMLGVAAGAAAVLLIAAGSSGGDSADPPPPTPPPPGDGPGGGGDTGSLGGTYNVTTTVANNPGKLPVLLDKLVLQVGIIGTALTITQTSSNPDFPGKLSGTITDNSFVASSSGTYSGTSTVFRLAGSLSVAQGLNFLIIVGSDGALPGGETITYNAAGTK